MQCKANFKKHLPFYGIFDIIEPVGDCPAEPEHIHCKACIIFAGDGQLTDRFYYIQRDEDSYVQ